MFTAELYLDPRPRGVLPLNESRRTRSIRQQDQACWRRLEQPFGSGVSVFLFFARRFGPQTSPDPSVLDLSFNLLKLVPDTLHHLTSLRTVYFVQNRISKITGLQGVGGTLRSLELGGNKLRVSFNTISS